MTHLVAYCSRGTSRPPADRLLARLPGLISPPDAPADLRILVEDDGLVLASIGDPRGVTSDGRGLFGLRHASLPVAPMVSPDPAARGHPQVPVLVEATTGSLVVTTNAVASRTLFRVATGDLVAISTSQAALAFLLGDVDVAQRAVGSMVTTGTLGYQDGWDARVRRVPPSTRVKVDRSALVVEEARLPPPAGSIDLQSAMEAALGDVSLELSAGDAGDANPVLLPVSGGRDSRALALGLRDRGLDAVTWGHPGSASDPLGDVQVAKRLADGLGYRHTVVTLDETALSAPTVFDRFVRASEGRTDYIGGYVDGFAMYESMRANGYQVLVRGDCVFGAAPTRTEAMTRWLIGCPHPKDVSTFAPHLEAMREHWGDLDLTDDLVRAEHESMAHWRDRLYRSFRSPVITASLTQTKSPYVEVVSPWLDDRVVQTVAELPDDDRTAKAGFAEVLARWDTTGLPLASSKGTRNVASVLSAGGLAAHTREVVRSADLTSSVPRTLLRRALAEEAAVGGAQRATRTGLRRAASKLIPKGTRRFYRLGARSHSIPRERLVLRLAIATQTLEHLQAVAREGRSQMRAPQ